MRISDWSSDVCSSDLRLRIDAAGGLSWNGNATSLSALPPLLAAVAERAPGERPMLQIDAAAASDYGTLVRVLAAANGAGLQDIGFVRAPRTACTFAQARSGERQGGEDCGSEGKSRGA